MKSPRLLKATGLLPIYPENVWEEDVFPIDLWQVKQARSGIVSPEIILFLQVFKWSLFNMNLMGFCPDILRQRRREHQLMKQMDLTKMWWQTSYVPDGLNEMNKEDSSHYVS